MSTRRTSKEAHDRINRTGELGAMQVKVYNALYTSGPLTGRQLNEMLSNTPDNSASFHKRLSELRKWGVVMEVGERRDSRTGMMNTLWDVTDMMPMKPEEPPTTVVIPTGCCPHCGQVLKAEV